MTTLPRQCQKQSDRQARPSSVTDPDQGQSTLARIYFPDGAGINTDLQGLGLMDSPRRLGGQDHTPTDQQPPGLETPNVW